MKKGMVGCLGVGVLVLAVGAGVAWKFVVAPMVGAGTEVADGARNWTQAVDAELAVVNQSPFVPPADGRMSQQQVNAFVGVLSGMQLRLGPEFAELRTLWEQQQADQAAGRAPAKGKDAKRAQARLDALLAKAREAQVEALNGQRLSLAEFRWMRDQAYAALPFLDMDPDAIVAPRPPPGAAVDAATGEVIFFPDEPVLADATTGALPPLPEDDGLEYAGSAPEDEELDGMPTSPMKPARPAPPPDSIEALGEVEDRGLGDDRELDSPAAQAARANAVLLRPHQDLLLRTLGASWIGL
jgi:hypothetical protein